MPENDIEALNAVYKELAQLIGYTNMQKVFEHYKGQQLSFPTRIYCKEYTLRVLEMEYNGENAKILARKLGYSERWIKQLVKELPREEN